MTTTSCGWPERRFPPFVAEAIETHLARIYAREVKREGPDRIVEFWNDVDGTGTRIDHWMAETVAPLLLVLGQLDVCLDHPRASRTRTVETRADLMRLGLDRCLAGVILPQDMLWWKLDASNQYYVECLVKESCDEGAGPALSVLERALSQCCTTSAARCWR